MGMVFSSLKYFVFFIYCTILNMHDFMLRIILLFAFCIVFSPLSVTHQKQTPSQFWLCDTLVENRCFPACCGGDCSRLWTPALCLCRLLLFTFTAQWPWLCWSSAFVMYFRMARSSLCSGSLVQSIMKRGLCLAPCQTWLSAQIWTRNGELLLVYASMHESMWFRGSELRNDFWWTIKEFIYRTPPNRNHVHVGNVANKSQFDLTSKELRDMLIFF